MDPPAESRREPRSHEDGVCVGDVVGGEDDRPFTGNRVEVALDVHAGEAARHDAGAERDDANERRDVALEDLRLVDFRLDDGPAAGSCRHRRLTVVGRVVSAWAAEIVATTASTVCSNVFPSV